MNATVDVSATPRERELVEMIHAFNAVTERMKESHERLGEEVRRLRVELVEKNRELARRERLAALGRMAAGVAHEIRNPLAGIRLYASMLQKDLGDRPRERDTVIKIDRAIVGLDLLVGDILLFAGNASLSLTEVPVAELVDDVIELSRPRQRELAATVSAAATRGRLVLRCDRNQVTRALLNLLLNALDAAGERGRVFIEVLEGTDRISLLIDDSGPGVPQGMADQIFNPFFTTKDSGTGLGLAIVHRVAEVHGGRVSCTSAPTGGARFVLDFPNPGNSPDASARSSAEPIATGA